MRWFKRHPKAVVLPARRFHEFRVDLEYLHWSHGPDQNREAIERMRWMLDDTDDVVPMTDERRGELLDSIRRTEEMLASFQSEGWVR